MDERKHFIDAHRRGNDSVAELARRYGISRETAYKWIHRFAEGLDLEDPSRRPRSNARAVAPAVASRGLLLEREVAELIDDEQLGPGVEGEPGGVRPVARTARVPLPRWRGRVAGAACVPGRAPPAPVPPPTPAPAPGPAPHPHLAAAPPPASPRRPRPRAPRG